MTPRRRTLFALPLVLALGLFGCGDDDDDTTGSASGSASGSGSEEAAGGEGDLATYCETTAEIETLGEPEIDFESATEDEIVEATKAFAADEVVPLAHEIQAAAPEAVREDIDILVAKVEELAETGDFEATFDDEFTEVQTRVHAHDVDNCGWQRVDVSAVNYAFEGIPETLEAGITTFEFSNEGTELHELIILRKNDDATETFDELLALPEEEARTKVSDVGAAFGAPGEEGLYTVADLSAGDYLAICFIPVGSVDEETEAEGPPHFTQGMKTEFTVS